MAIEVSTPQTHELAEVLERLRLWQVEGAAIQLHPGDIGWFWRFGAQQTAEALRVWRSDGQVVAVGLLDGADLIRVTIAPLLRHDEELARRVAEDVATPSLGILGAGEVSVEVPPGAILDDVLAEAGWMPGERWSPLWRDLTEPVEDAGLRVEIVGPELVAERVATHRASFVGSRLTAENWHAMAAGLAYADARCLVAFDADDAAVAAVTVWAAGAGRSGLIEPLGVHEDHRGKGYGAAITRAAAAALRDLGSSSVMVCTRSANVGAVATYVSGGMTALPERLDRTRPA